MQYSVTAGENGYRYEKLVDEQWVSMSEDEARTRGIWRDPRGGQYQVRDPLAAPEQVEARDKGFYDPRPASGPFVAALVLVRCAECGARISDVEEYERRILVHHLPTGRRYWSDLDRWSLYRCGECDRGQQEVDTSKVRAAIDRARLVGRKITTKI